MGQEWPKQPDDTPGTPLAQLAGMKAIRIVAVVAMFAVSRARAAPDATLIWLAAGDHDAPCDAGLRCASHLDCDPQSLRCRLPAHLELSVDDISGCDPDFEVVLDASNRGEIALDEEVLVRTSIKGSYYIVTCGPGSGWKLEECTWSGELVGPINTSFASVRVHLAPGAWQRIVVPIDASLPKFTLEANVSIDIEASTSVPPYQEPWSTTEFSPEHGTDVCY